MADQSTQSPLQGNAVIGQSGGPTAVINQSLAGIVEALRGGNGIDKILGYLHGVTGIVSDQFVELQDIPQQRLERIAQTPSAALGSSRVKPDDTYCQRIFAHFAKHNVRYFFYIGGNDSSDTCRIVNELSNKAGYELHCFHVPKTIDNDLMHNDHTPGFGSAAKFVAQAFIGDNLDNRALPGIKIDVIMGRHAGFLTAASALARQNKDDGPHLIYVPEVAFNEEKFVADVERIYSRLKRCVIAVSEGIHEANGIAIVEKLTQGLEQDPHGNIQLSGTGALGDYLATLIRKNLGKDLRVRADTFGYLQRSFAGCTSTVDAQEARAVGRKAAEAALAGHTDGSIAIQRTNNDPYKADFQLIDLGSVAAKTRTLDRTYIVDDNNIDDRYKDYLRPLVGQLPVVESLRVSQ